MRVMLIKSNNIKCSKEEAIMMKNEKCHLFFSRPDVSTNTDYSPDKGC
jgi:hypothetical protein